MLKKAVFLIALGYSIALGTASLITIKNLPGEDISFADKIFHFLAYSFFTILWYLSFFYTFKLKRKKAIIYALVLAILFGIVIEVLQDVATISRTLDGYDILANTLGALGAILVINIKRSL